MGQKVVNGVYVRVEYERIVENHLIINYLKIYIIINVIIIQYE